MHPLGRRLSGFCRLFGDFDGIPEPNGTEEAAAANWAKLNGSRRSAEVGSTPAEGSMGL